MSRAPWATDSHGPAIAQSPIENDQVGVFKPKGGFRFRSGFDAARQEALGLQQFDIPGTGLVLAERRLGVMPDDLVPVGQLLAVLVDERLQDLIRRSSSAWAKNALANFRISLALRNSRTSRSSASAA